MLRSRRCTAPTPNGRCLRDSLRFTPEGLSDCEHSLQGLEGGTKGSSLPEPPVRGNAADFLARVARFCEDAYDADTDRNDSEVRVSGFPACLFCLATSHISLERVCCSDLCTVSCVQAAPSNNDDFLASVARFCEDAYDADTDPNDSEVHVSVFLEAGMECVVV